MYEGRQVENGRAIWMKILRNRRRRFKSRLTQTELVVDDLICRGCIDALRHVRKDETASDTSICTFEAILYLGTGLVP